jgi:hypothetical protein
MRGVWCLRLGEQTLGLKPLFSLVAMRPEAKASGYLSCGDARMRVSALRYAPV